MDRAAGAMDGQGLYDHPPEAIHDGDNESDAGMSDVSDADSEYLRVQDQIDKANADRTAFLETFEEAPSSAEEQSHSPQAIRKAPKRAPRKVKELPTEIKLLISAATNAFLEERYDEALLAAKETIRLNAEVPSAWGILATVYEERGDWRHALEAKRIQASLTRTDVQLWLATADLALRIPDPAGGPGSSPENLRVAMECYTCLLQVDRTNLVARLAKADVLADLGDSGKAVVAYREYLKARPHNLQAVRNLAEHAFNARRAKEATQFAVEAYRCCIDHSRGGKPLDDQEVFDWIDIRIFIELLASLGQYAEAAGWLMSLARWLLGRPNDTAWDGCGDDREWDLDDKRRQDLPSFYADVYSPASYGQGMPLDLRGKLAVYRLKLKMEDEAMRHLSWLDPEDLNIREALAYTPAVAKEIADELCENNNPQLALAYYDMYRELAEPPLDAGYFVSRAKCHLQLSDGPAAEDCFISALEVDEDNIDARYELAKMYEEAHERDEAFRLVGEALSLEAGHSEQSYDTHRFILDRGKLVQKPRKYRHGLTRSTGRGKYRPRRLGDKSTRRRFEEEVAARLREKFELCRRLKAEMAAAGDDGDDGGSGMMAEWMGAAKELVDDFRSFRDFYSWEKYVSSLGYGNFFKMEGEPAAADAGCGGAKDASITNLAKRLHSKLAPAEAEAEEQPTPQQLDRHEHRGIPFDDWLDLFLEYAVGLARQGRTGDAYAVCQSARDSIVYNKARDSMTLIHLAWASCAVHAGDEETCVAVARYFINQNSFVTDAYMLFAALCRLCQTSSTWYQSGPSQKFMLRQIRQMDEIVAARAREATAVGATGERASLPLPPPPPPPAQATEPMMEIDTQQPHDQEQQPQPQPPQAPTASVASGPAAVDTCLLVMYGCILFSSTSYQYALAYFLRARTLDPDGPAVNLVVALAYVHWSLKRQSQNRQYSLMQGLAYLFRYHDVRSRSASREERQEAHFNVARAYHLLGIHDLAVAYYRKVLAEAEAEGEGEGAVVGGCGRRRREDLVLEAALNMRTYCLTTGDLEGARAITERWLVLA
ncbi:hypothetical protein GGTG_09538 [Gaeumannomyces tritici R3-111a-1]|uniref:Transcription factor tau subunit sfc4 n=1 Tax=Gaeumannomyces tritici (strain R3-111a-1) TaxID=644352 RepID=J3P7P7_GAET3|nr:hypothetical protein GGTG_09538 [Gaeumannomyces tritici R3-111a-1]EJT72679.1 hypothetical protein GGTG_09538 [Gaeumannomyces tritici R3-111a-1]